MGFGGKSNPLFNLYGASSNGIGQDFHTPEQLLLQGLITEAIAIYGLDMFYVPRILNNLENLYSDSPKECWPETGNKIFK